VGGRTSAAYTSLFKNGRKLDYREATSGSLPDKSVWIGARNHPTTIGYATGNIAYASIGSGITDAANGLYWAAVKKLMIALGRRTADITSVRAGVAFSFDDEVYITFRLQLKWLSAMYGMKHSQFIDGDVGDWSVAELKDLFINIDNSCSVGSHGLNSSNAQAYIAGGGTAQEYYDNEIAPNVMALNTALSITVKSFAYPFSKEVDAITTILLAEGFTFIRSGAVVDDNAYYDGSNQFIESLTLNNTAYTLEQYKAFVDAALANDKILLLHGHIIGDTANSLYISYATLVALCAYINSKGMTYYNVDELLPALFV